MKKPLSGVTLVGAVFGANLVAMEEARGFEGAKASAGIAPSAIMLAVENFIFYWFELNLSDLRIMSLMEEANDGSFRDERSRLSKIGVGRS